MHVDAWIPLFAVQSHHDLYKDISHQPSGCFIMYADPFCDVGSEHSSIFLLTEEIVVAYVEIHMMQNFNTSDLIYLKAEHKPIPNTGRVSTIFKSKKSLRMEMLESSKKVFFFFFDYLCSVHKPHILNSMCY